MRQHSAHVLGKLLVGRLTDIVPIQIIELLEVEPRRALVDAVDVEPSNDVLRRHDLIVAVAPAEAHEIVAQGRRQIAHSAIFFDALGAVTF